MQYVSQASLKLTTILLLQTPKSWHESPYSFTILLLTKSFSLFIANIISDRLERNQV